jgi:signal transduction histidine kinase/ActR/RegA family two-component response regulator
MRLRLPAFLRASLSAKLVCGALAATLLALGFGTALFLASDWRRDRDQLIEQRIAVARVLADNVAAPVVFHDAKGANDTLASVRNIRSVRSVYVFDSADGLVAQYGAQYGARYAAATGAPQSLRTGWRLSPDHLDVAMPIMVDREQVGRLVLVSDLKDLRATLRAYLIAALLSFASAAAIAASISVLLARAIIAPVRDLSSGMAAVRAGGDIDRRVPRTSDDEIGTLTDEFNALLEQLATNEHALRATVAALTEARDAAEAATVAKSQFLANMSHEIRTPLNGVVGVVDALSRTPLDGRQREMVELVRSSGQTLERLLSDVLDISRIESGKLEIETRPFDLNAAVHAVASLMALRAQEKGVAFVVEMEVGDDVWVVGDEVRIKQILTNLISNAVKFTDGGEVRLHGEGIGGDAYRFTVTDTGVGFDASRKDQIFGRFQQADSSITRRFGGSGLGLAISGELATLMGGVLDCESVLGEGSRFWVSLPLERCAKPVSEVRDSARNPADERLIRVLLADDHPVNRRVVQMILEGAEVDLVAVEDGLQAVETFALGGFDLVLMDMQMPVMDGLSATRAIRAHEAAHSRHPTPIVMLTANAGREYVEAAAQAGADAHLAKPISAEALLQLIADVAAEGAVQDAPGRAGRIASGV